MTSRPRFSARMDTEVYIKLPTWFNGQPLAEARDRNTLTPTGC
jgi:hypothetical protein